MREIASYLLKTIFNIKKALLSLGLNAQDLKLEGKMN